MQYEYSWGGRIYSVSAKEVGEHFEKLEKKYGEVTRDNFLASAYAKNSKMHKLFEWNDTKAANLYRLQQANQIINSLRVTVIDMDNNKHTAPAFVNVGVRGSGESKYISVVKAMKVDEQKNQVLEDARMDAARFKFKYGSLAELADVITAMDEFMERTA